MATVLVVCRFDWRDMYAEYLRAHGLRVVTASGPDEALLLLEEETPDLAITDAVFPGSPIDFSTFITELRFRLDDATSIVVVTGLADERTGREARLAGADLYLIAPVLPEVLLSEVNRGLILRRSGRRVSWKSDARPQPAKVTPARKRHAS